MTSVAPSSRLIRSLRPVAGVFTLVHVIFLLGVLLVRPDAELAAVSPSPRSVWEAVAGLFWFLVLPLLLEVLVVGVPLAWLLNCLQQHPKQAGGYLGALALGAPYFFFAASLYGTEPAAYKTGLLGGFVALLLGWMLLSDETDDE